MSENDNESRLNKERPAHYGFYEKYDDRKKRIAKEKAVVPQRPVGRPRRVATEQVAQVMSLYEVHANASEVARILKINRSTVTRCLNRQGIKTDRLPTSIKTDFYEVRISLDGPVYRAIRSAAKLRGRSLQAEMRACFARTYE